MSMKVAGRLEQFEDREWMQQEIRTKKNWWIKSMQLQGQFGRDAEDKKSEELWNWLRHAILKKQKGCY